MSHDHMSMGSMGMLPALTEWPDFYYAVVGAAMGIATLFNVYSYVLYRQRMLAVRGGSRTPAKPRSWFALGNATLFALTREASNFSFRIPLKGRILRLPTVGRSSLIAANVIVLVVLCLYGFDVTDQFSMENIGFRCGVVTIAQLPIIILLAGKNNIIGYLGGVSYERLNWLHRWCARCMLLTATMHIGYFFSAWAPYDYIGYQLKNNKIVWKGLAAWCTLAWIVFSSMTPIRGWNYEIFVIQHIISFAVFLAFVYIHTPIEMHGYIWAPVAIFLFDRVFRALRLLYINTALFHPSLKRRNQTNGLWACKAEFIPLPHNTTRIVIPDPPISWIPGQHVYLSCHSIVPLQSHPFTVASIPEDGRMEFYVKAEKGGTKHFSRHAEKPGSLSGTAAKAKTVAIEGPYGTLRPLRQFDSVILLAGSTGGTFTLPLLRDLVQGWKENARGDTGNTSFFKTPTGSATRHVRFVWVVKSRGQLSWFSGQFTSICTEFRTLQETLRDIKLEMTVYITCDESFTEEHNSLLSGMTAPNTNAARQIEPKHGAVQLRSVSQTATQNIGTKSDKEGYQEVESLDSESLDIEQISCGPNGTCCCRAAIDESDSPSAGKAVCCCSKPKDTASSRPASLATSTPSSLEPNKRVVVHPAIGIYSGRPKTRDIIRRSLEQALGESAVVVCGPQGLVADVKHDVVCLSDERAVHKGTGAQGIYLHTESFGW
jgi:predicted ferric reductase